MTGGRVALASLAFAAAAAAAGCTSNDTANIEANRAAAGQGTAGRPQVTITSKGNAPQPQPTAAGLQTLPPEVLSAEIPTVDGKTFRLSDYKDKVVVLNLWATWCGPCRLEIPHLVELSKEYGGKGVEVVGLTTENPEMDAEKVRGFAKEYKIPYRLGWADATLARALMQGNYSIPQSFVLLPGGRIHTKFRGFSNEFPAKIRAAVNSASGQMAGD